MYWYAVLFLSCEFLDLDFCECVLKHNFFLMAVSAFVERYRALRVMIHGRMCLAILGTHRGWSWMRRSSGLYCMRRIARWSFGLFIWVGLCKVLVHSGRPCLALRGD